MMQIFVILTVLVLFYLLGKAADLVILNIREIGEKLGIGTFFLGILLGFLTSLPELSLGINAIINNVQAVSLGNLFGGIIVLFGLILGISLVLNRKIKTNGEVMEYAMVVVYIFFPLFMGLDGKLGFVDGLILVAVYFYLLYMFYIKHKNHNVLELDINRRNHVLKKCLLILAGLVSVIIISSWIIKLFIFLLNDFNYSIFLIGLILFSLGTNLPELIVVIRSYHGHIKELAISNLIGSAMANVMMIGMFASIKPFSIEVNISYYALMFFTVLLLVSFLVFYRSDNALSRREGFALIGVYIIFLIIQSKFLVGA